MAKIKHFSLPSQFSVQPFEDDRFLKIRFKFINVGKNLNNSTFSFSAIDNAKDTICNIPILAYVEKGKDEIDFKAHEMHLEEVENEDGELIDYKLVYDEKCVGVIPENGNNYHYEDDEDGVRYAYVDGYIWKEYCSDVVEILERDKEVNMSMEIKIKKSKYDFKTKILDITDYSYNGLTLLGKQYDTGIKDANAKIITFELNNEISKRLDELNETLKFNLNNKNKDIDILAEKANKSNKFKKGIMEMEDDSVKDELKEEKFEQEIDKEKEEDKKEFEVDIPDEDEKIEEVDKGSDDEKEEDKEEFVEDIKKEEVKEDKEDYELKYNQLKSEYENSMTEYEALKQKYSEMETRVNQLEEYKNCKMSEEKEKLYSQIKASGKISEVEFEEFKLQTSDLDLEQVQEKYFVLLGKKSFSFSKENQVITMGIDNGLSDFEGTGKPYDYILKKLKK